jgi:uncharacterized MAPEG superfamily protein
VQVAGNVAGLPKATLNSLAATYLVSRIVFTYLYVNGTTGTSRRFDQSTQPNPIQSNSIRRILVPATQQRYASLTRTVAWGHARSFSWLAGIISCCTLFVRAGNKYF